ncbi:2Fe-2S iron-sulfur cluster-binding protein [Actinoplanes sp. G11-F43]|uniref:2Fe-2S iron-sulfur cluster-binding protein n=1 Tax=Actinoplanes sp. G11-F43 TaxID=3424130 RepID=UPI003D32AB9D
MRVTLIVAGQRRVLEVEPRRTLAEVLHEDLHQSRAGRECDDGTCRACLVTVDGVEVCSCLMLAVQCDGAHVS